MTIYSFVAEDQATSSISTVRETCRVLDVSTSGYYDWHRRGPSERNLSDRRLAIEIEAIWECSDHTYRSPRVHRWSQHQGFVVGHNRVARILPLEVATSPPASCSTRTRIAKHVRPISVNSATATAW